MTGLRALAVLHERNLEQTLQVLCVELENAHRELDKGLQMITLASKAQHAKMIETMQQSNQTSLMLYSQKNTYTFNLTYACHEAAEQYRAFTKNQVPYDRIIEKLDGDIMRYTNLIETLRELPPSLADSSQQDLATDSIKLYDILNGGDSVQTVCDTLNVEEIAAKTNEPFLLSDSGQVRRKESLAYAELILKQLQCIRDEVGQDSEHYTQIGNHLKSVYAYAQQRYKEIQQSIFVNGESNYFSILASLPIQIKQAGRDLIDKYGDRIYREDHVKSEWRGRIIFGLIVIVTFYFLLAALLSNIIVRVLMKKVKRLRENKELQLKMDCVIIASSLCLFALVMMGIQTFMHHNFVLMASSLLISFSWLVTIILLSLLIRLNGTQMQAALRLFMPIVVLGFIVIIFRIIFIPNSLVNLIFPPILLAFTVWQWFTIHRWGKDCPAIDRAYSWISFVLMAIASGMAWFGYVLMSVQVFIWWLMQLMITLTLTCLYDLLNVFERRHLQKALGLKNPPKRGWLKRDGKNIVHTWFYDLLLMAVLPICIVQSLLLSVYLAAEVFDLTELCLRLFVTPFVNIEGACRLAVDKIVLVIILWFIFNYICYLIKSLYHHFRMQHLGQQNKGVQVAVNQANFTLFYNITAIVVWGTYFILALMLLQVPKSGISIVTAGLATGIGFAMKDLLNNFFYGISLMTGRLRVGDWIECDGVIGKVDSITYQSTQILTEEGSIIAFLNSTLFSRNFKNLTRNHFYVKSKAIVGVAYGTDIDQVRNILIEAVSSLNGKNKTGRDIIDPHRGVSVFMTELADSSVNLGVFYWPLVSEKTGFDCRVKEAIYKALNAHNIEIPFPQRDLHILPVSAANTFTSPTADK